MPRRCGGGIRPGEHHAAVGGTNPPVWIAGFDEGRAATPGFTMTCSPWPRSWTTAIRGSGSLAIDRSGFFHDDVVRVRQRPLAGTETGLRRGLRDANHSTPDLMGLWGRIRCTAGVNPDYRDRVIAASASALEAAVGTLQPATMSVLEIPVSPAGLQADTRKPRSSIPISV